MGWDKIKLKHSIVDLRLRWLSKVTKETKKTPTSTAEQPYVKLTENEFLTVPLDCRDFNFLPFLWITFSHQINPSIN